MPLITFWTFKHSMSFERFLFVLWAVYTSLEVIKLEFILKLKIKRSDWLLADMFKIKRSDWLLADMCPQAANHCALF